MIRKDKDADGVTNNISIDNVLADLTDPTAKCNHSSQDVSSTFKSQRWPWQVPIRGISQFNEKNLFSSLCPVDWSEIHCNSLTMVHSTCPWSPLLSPTLLISIQGKPATKISVPYKTRRKKFLHEIRRKLTIIAYWIVMQAQEATRHCRKDCV